MNSILPGDIKEQITRYAIYECHKELLQYTRTLKYWIDMEVPLNKYDMKDSVIRNEFTNILYNINHGILKNNL